MYLSMVGGHGEAREEGLEHVDVLRLPLERLDEERPLLREGVAGGDRRREAKQLLALAREAEQERARAARKPGEEAFAERGWEIGEKKTDSAFAVVDKNATFTTFACISEW